MKEEVKEKGNVLDILRKAKSAINSKDIFTLKELSNRTIHNASIYQDSDSISIAVVVYALAKVIERSKYSYYKDWPVFMKAVNYSIDKAISDLEKDDADSFREDISSIRKAVNKASGNLKRYIEDVFRKALINKASRIYEHGISLEQTAYMLGITPFELSEYAGKTGIGDVSLSITMPFEKRFKRAWEFFK